MSVLCEIFGLFVNTLTDDGKSSVLYRDNLTQQIHILLSKKPKACSQLPSKILKLTLNFEHFQKKDDLYSRCSSQITVSEKGD